MGKGGDGERRGWGKAGMEKKTPGDPQVTLRDGISTQRTIRR
jgi:hypothetical protein